MKTIRELIKEKRVYFDGGTGTVLQGMGLPAGQPPELWNLAKKAAEGREEAYVAFDMGPTGRLLEPLGDLSFEEAVSIYADNVRIAAACGVDLVLIETMNDSLETKAAVLAVKENSDLPVFVTNVYDAGGKLRQMGTARLTSLQSLPAGIYIIQVNNTSFKIRKQ